MSSPVVSIGCIHFIWWDRYNTLFITSECLVNVFQPSVTLRLSPFFVCVCDLHRTWKLVQDSYINQPCSIISLPRLKKFEIIFDFSLLLFWLTTELSGYIYFLKHYLQVFSRFKGLRYTFTPIPDFSQASFLNTCSWRAVNNFSDMMSPCLIRFLTGSSPLFL